ncbi:MAG: cell division protein FtsW [Caldilineae bacterium]|nr:MAG: cell division protein FtsW [Caldilineae bacterium]
MRNAKTQQPEFDYTLLVLVTVLLGFGLVMLFSASYETAYVKLGDPLYYFTRQLIWTLLGLAAMLVLINIDYRLWRELAIPILGITMLGLIAVLFVGEERFGARRQILGGSIQPSEIAKLSIVIYIGAWLASKGKDLRKVSYGLIPFAVLLGLLVGLIVIQPDISTAALVTVTAGAMFFVAGADVVQIGILGLMGGLTFAGIITQQSHARERVIDYLQTLPNPLSSPDFQVREGILALVEGGFFGTGLANSVHKRPGGLPAVHSDSIFAVVGEELGLIGTLSILALFLYFAYRGVRIALRAPDAFGSLVAFGITTWLVLQALFNIAVITATFPYTGLPLPFFTYGGSAMLANLAAVGILLNISRGGQGITLDALTRLWRRNRRPRVSHSQRRRGATRILGNTFARHSNTRR